MITRVEAFQYRAFERLDITLRPYQVFVGPNGSGKSTLLDIPALFSDILRYGLTAAFLEETPVLGLARAQSFSELIYRHRGEYFAFAIEAVLPQDVVTKLAGVLPRSRQGDERRWPNKLRYTIRFQVFGRSLDVAGEYLHLFPAAMQDSPSEQWGVAGVPSDARTIVSRDVGAPAVVKGELNTRRSLSLRLDPGQLALDEVPNDDDQYPAVVWFKELLRRGVLHYRPDPRRLRQPARPGQPATVASDAANLPWLVLDLKRGNPDLYEAWVEHVRTALPMVVGIDAVEHEDLHQAYLKVTYEGDYVVTSIGLSEGTLRILALTVLPYLRQHPGLVMIEEPEDGIHPQGIEAVLQSLQSLYGSQVWVASHSPIVLAQTELEDIIVMRSDPSEGATATRGPEHPHLRDWQGEINLGSLFAAGVLG